MGQYDYLIELFVLAKESIKKNMIDQAKEKIREAEREFISKSTASDRAKVDELNESLFLMKRELRILEAFILNMEKSHGVDLSGFKTQLKQFNQHLEAIRREKKFISFR